MARCSILLLFGFLLLLGCGKDSDYDNKQLGQILIDTHYNNQDFAVGDTLPFKGESIVIHKLQYYFSSIEVLDFESLIEFVDLELMTPGNPVIHGFDFSNRRPNQINITFGLSQSTNQETSPADYDINHPLGAIGNKGMYWTWATGYKFILLEAEYLESGKEGFPISWHLGSTKKTYSKLIPQRVTEDLTVEFDLYKILREESTWKNNPTLHTPSPLVDSLLQVCIDQGVSL